MSLFLMIFHEKYMSCVPYFFFSQAIFILIAFHTLVSLSVHLKPLAMEPSLKINHNWNVTNILSVAAVARDTKYIFRSSKFRLKLFRKINTFLIYKRLSIMILFSTPMFHLFILLVNRQCYTELKLF